MAKGQDFERNLCKQLSLWWTQDKNPPDDAVFWRTAGSGARATTRAKKNLKTSNSHGDICTLDDIGIPFLKVLILELKRGYGKVHLHDLLDLSEEKQRIQIKNEVDGYPHWITKAERDRQRAGALYWAIIHKRDHRNILLTMQGGFWFGLPSRIRTNIVFRGCVAVLHLIDGTTVVTTQLSDFFSVVKPKDILAMLDNGPNDTKQAPG